MRYAVIGTGYWGSNHARVAAELADDGLIDEVFLCDVDEQRVTELAESYDVTPVTDYTKLASYGVDAATLSTPSPTHHEIATRLLRDGIDVLVEKPLALSSKEAWDLVSTADTEGRTLAVGHIFRHHPALCELKRRIDRGELGRIKHIATNRFSFRTPRETTGVLFSLAVHDVDISNFLLDDYPEMVFCSTDMVIREGIDETATVVLEYENATSVINESWQIPVFGKRRDLVVVGSEKSAYIDYLDDTVLELYDSRIVERNGTLSARDEGKQVYEAPKSEPLRAEVEEFLAASRGETTVSAPGSVGANAVELLEFAELSAERKQTVRVTEDEPTIAQGQVSQD